MNESNEKTRKKKLKIQNDPSKVQGKETKDNYIEKCFFDSLNQAKGLNPKQKSFIRLSIVSGQSISKVLRSLNLSRQTYYNWRATNPEFEYQLIKTKSLYFSAMEERLLSLHETALQNIASIIEKLFEDENIDESIEAGKLALKWLTLTNQIVDVGSKKDDRKEVRELRQRKTNELSDFIDSVRGRI